MPFCQTMKLEQFLVYLQILFQMKTSSMKFWPTLSPRILRAQQWESQFPIRVWNNHEAAVERSKTTNCCEGPHNALNSVFQCSHPGFWFLLDGPERDLAFHKYTLEKARVGQPDVKKNKCEALHDRVAHIVQGYQEEQDKLRFFEADGLISNNLCLLQGFM